MSEEQITWEKIKDHMSVKTEKSKMKLFATLYNFLYKNIGTDKAIYVKPIVEEMPEIIVILDEYFNLQISVDNETKKVIYMIRAKALKNPKECTIVK